MPHPVPPQSQPVHSFAHSHPIKYQLLSSSQMPPNSQAPKRFNYSVNQGPQNVTFMSPSAVAYLPVRKPGTHIHGVLESPSLKPVHDAENVITSVTSVTNVTVKSAALSIGEKATDPMLNNSAAAEKNESSQPQVDAEIFMDGSMER